MGVFEERYKKLNKQQELAVEAIEGPVMVIAGPGSGKTELLSLRVANILSKVDIAPQNILCLTFTDAAAFNMRQRLAGLLGREAYRVAIHTFHSFGVEIINRYPEHFYNGASFLPADDITQTEILEDIFSSLDHGNPLRAEHNNQFTYLYKAKKAVEYLKKAGLNPTEFKKVVAENEKNTSHIDPIIQSVFEDRISKSIFPSVLKAIKSISEYKSGTMPGMFKSLSQSVALSLAKSLKDAEESGLTAPITEWKKNWTGKGDDKKTHLKDFNNQEKIKALADIYEKYAARMHEEGYYDYNDMILDTIEMLEKKTGVRLDLQERYQYILVDEFQDTNDAQMRLLRLLTDHPVNEGRPNVMVVGDDDQAIYKFQGAEITNITSFKESYKNPTIIVLKENYRSTQEILDSARHIIQKGTNQLEKILPEIKKELVASNKELKEGAIHGKEFPSREVEYHWVAGEVKRLIEKGISSRQIAVIAREHKDLEGLVPYFHSAKIPISYERQENVIQEPLVLQLITMARFVDSIMRKDEDADNFLPEILSYPFWSLERAEIWELSIKARQEHKPWLMTMRESGGRLKEIADFFIELGAKATYATTEEILHELIGGPQQILPDDDSEDEVVVRNDMFSPFRSFYFSKDNFKKHRADYLRFLSSLQSFIGSLREYRRGKRVTTAEMIEFFDMHVKNNLAINNISPFMNSENAVQFMSAHKAKGLEFEAVFVINCQEDTWADGGRGYGVPLPMNLPIAPAGDNLDDQLRLFYVAMTRARRILYLTSYRTDIKGKESARLGFLAPEGAPQSFKSDFIEVKDMGKEPGDVLNEQWVMRHAPPFVPDEKALLAPVLENYQLSVTHLQNFLNVADAGPLTFLEKNLLMFPEPKTPSGAFGSAVHKTIQRVYIHLKDGGKLPSTKDVLSWFEKLLMDERLNERDFGLLLKRGQKSIEAFYTEKKDDFSPQDIIELSFKTQGVVVNDVSLTGKIDRMRVLDGKIEVCDFKTGKVIRDWSPSDPYEKIKAWRYRQQLIFYKLLIENSRDFGGKYSVNKGTIEFIEPLRGEIMDLPIEIEKEEVKRVEDLISVVNKKIKALEFPGISGYSKDIKGITAFEDDLLKELN